MNSQSIRRGLATYFVLSLLTTQSGAIPWKEEFLAAQQTPEGRLEITSIGTGGRLWLNGRMIAEFDESDAFIARRWPDQLPTFLLLNLPTGGGSCPDLYRLLDLSRPGKPYLTGSFGNCHANPTLKVEGSDVSVLFPATPERPAATWTYDPSRRCLDDPFNGAVTGPLF